MNRPSALVAMLQLKCPRCRQGKAFVGHFAMNENCPICQLRFEREPGYFLGAMYVSYALSVILLGLIILLGSALFSSLRLEIIIGFSVPLYLPFVPAVFRYSRIIWMYFDRWASPGD